MVQDFHSFTESNNINHTEDINEAKGFAKTAGKMLAKAGNFAIDAIVQYLIDNPDTIKDLGNKLKSKDKDLYGELKS